MKTYRFVLLAAVLLASLAALAQGGMGQGGRHGGQMPTVDQRVQQLTQQLNLTSDQQTQVRGILQDQLDQIQKLRDDTSIPREQKRPQMRQIHETAMSKIRALLNPDQQKKFDAMQQEQQQRMQQHEHGGSQTTNP